MSDEDEPQTSATPGAKKVAGRGLAELARVGFLGIVAFLVDIVVGVMVGVADLVLSIFIWIVTTALDVSDWLYRKLDLLRKR
jgi:hypothetical protein